MIEEMDIGQSATLTDMAMCLNHYRLSSPGLYVCVHVPVQLDEDIRVVPGVIAQVNYGKHKQCDPGDYQYFSGPPNFIFDAFRDDQQDEYTYRHKHFERCGVIEYVVWFNSAEMPVWNRLIDGKYHEIEADTGGVIMSSALPGLWFPLNALKSRNWWAIMSATTQGMSRKEHHEFMETIWKK